jgi:hypothetical protein
MLIQQLETTFRYLSDSFTSDEQVVNMGLSHRNTVTSAKVCRRKRTAALWHMSARFTGWGTRHLSLNVDPAYRGALGTAQFLIIQLDTDI